MAVITDEHIGLNPLPRTEFVERFLEYITPLQDQEWMPLRQANGRILSQDMSSLYNLPSGRQTGGDSVVMRYAAFAEGMPSDEQTAQWVRGVDWERADMGDDFPDIFDCSTHIEGVELLDNGGIRLIDDPPVIRGPETITQPGSKMKVGDPLLPAGTVLTPLTIAYLASAGHTMVPVRRKVRVAFIPTGSELTCAGQVLKRGQTPDSNSFMMEQLILQAGAVPVMFPIISDSREALAHALEQARAAADLVLINGGSSKGGEDFNAALLSERATFYQHGVRLRPARVAAASVIDGIPHVNLPGPTMAARVVWEWLVRYALAKLAGAPSPQRVRVAAVLAEDAGPKGPGPKQKDPEGKGMPAQMASEEFMSFFRVAWEDGRYVAYDAGMGHGAGAAMQCNALCIQQRMGRLQAGTQIEVELL